MVTRDVLGDGGPYRSMSHPAPEPPALYPCVAYECSLPGYNRSTQFRIVRRGKAEATVEVAHERDQMGEWRWDDPSSVDELRAALKGVLG